jgi:hypothetical protein
MGGLAARPPRYIVLFRRGWPEGGAERVARFPELRRHLDERYRVVRERSAYIVYERRRDASHAPRMRSGGIPGVPRG